MNVVVNPGFAICAGGLKLEENQRTLAIQAADSNYDRIDTVVLRWNDNDSERICDLYIVEGIRSKSFKTRAYKNRINLGIRISRFIYK